MYNPVLCSRHRHAVNGGRGVAIPRTFFGIILYTSDGPPGTVNFVCGGTSNGRPLSDCIGAISRIRHVANVSFFPTLPSRVRRGIRTRCSLGL